MIADTHFARKGQVLSKQITKYFDKVDFIVHAGDFTHNSLVTALRRTGKFVGVFGNMDPMVIKRVLPEINEIMVGGIKIGIIHGWGAPGDIINAIHPICKKRRFDIVIFGHSHKHVEMQRDGISYFNPGSPVDKMFTKVNTFLILTIHSKERIDAEFIKVE
ncbi:MAG: metallophosphoesterase family protein [Promethearchaeota archaeon]